MRRACPKGHERNHNVFYRSTVSAATEATDTGDEDAVLREKIHEKIAAEKAKMSISDKEELFKVKTTVESYFPVLFVLH